MSSPAFVINANKSSSGGGGSLNPPLTSFMPLDAKNSTTWSDDTLTSCMCVPYDFVPEAQTPMDYSYSRLLSGLTPLDPTVANNASKKFSIPKIIPEFKTVASVAIAPARLPNPFGNTGYAGAQKLDATRWVLSNNNAIAVYDEATDTMGEAIDLGKLPYGGTSYASMHVISDGYIILTYVNSSNNSLRCTLFFVNGTTSVTEKNTITLQSSGGYYASHNIVSCKYSTDKCLIGYNRKVSSNYNIQVHEITYSADAITNTQSVDATGTHTDANQRRPYSMAYMSDKRCCLTSDHGNHAIVDIYDNAGTLTVGVRKTSFGYDSSDMLMPISETEVIILQQYSTGIYISYGKLAGHAWTTNTNQNIGSTSTHEALFVGEAGSNRIVILPDSSTGEPAYVYDIIGGTPSLVGRAVLPMSPTSGAQNRSGNGSLATNKGTFIASSGSVDIALNGSTVKTGEAYKVYTPVFLGTDVNSSKVHLEVTNKTGSDKAFSISDITCIT